MSGREKKLLEDHPAALNSFQKAIKINPQSTLAWKNREDALYNLYTIWSVIELRSPNTTKLLPLTPIMLLCGAIEG